MVPGRKFSHTTSAWAASRRNSVLSLGRPQVAGGTPAAPALDRPEQGVGPASSASFPLASDEGADGAHEVAAAGQLDLDHIGARARRGARRRTGAEMRVPTSRTRSPARGPG